MELDVPFEEFIYDNREARETISDTECLFDNYGISEIYNAIEQDRQETLAELVKFCINRLTEHQKLMKEELEKRKDVEYSNEEDIYNDFDLDNFTFN
jgi:hypothetical protein